MITITSLSMATIVLSDWLLVIGVTFAVLTNFAVLRSAAVKESFVKEASRRLKMAGFAVLSVRWWWLLMTQDALHIHVVAVIGLTIIAVGESLASLYALFPDEMDTHSQTKDLYGSRK